MNKRVLIIAREFPPFKIIGRIRTLKWCQHLPGLGWDVCVLTLNADSQGAKDQETYKEIPAETTVYRAPWPKPKERAVEQAKRLLKKRSNRSRGSASPPTDAPSSLSDQVGAENGKKRGLSDLLGLYDAFVRRHVLIPDAYITWTIPAVKRGLEAVKEFNPDVIFATAPAFSDFIVARRLAGKTGLPWVADYRDLWTGDVLREWIPKWRQRVEIGLEKRLLRSASAVVTVSEPKTSFVQDRVPQLSSERFFTITNGYDLEEYEGLEAEGGDDNVFRIVYTGRLFKNRRGYELIQALGELVAQYPEKSDKIRVEYYGGVAPEIETRMDELIQSYGLQSNVRFYPDVSYVRSKALQKGADALLLIVDTGETTSGVIPGKLFEYIAAGRPILCIAREGATPDIIRRGNLGWVVPPGDLQALKEVLSDMLHGSGASFAPDMNFLAQFDRRELAQKMDRVLRFTMNKRAGSKDSNERQPVT